MGRAAPEEKAVVIGDPWFLFLAGIMIGVIARHMIDVWRDP